MRTAVVIFFHRLFITRTSIVTFSLHCLILILCTYVHSGMITTILETILNLITRRTYLLASVRNLYLSALELYEI